jgi:hypothetical protein
MCLFWFSDFTGFCKRVMIVLVWRSSGVVGNYSSHVGAAAPIGGPVGGLPTLTPFASTTPTVSPPTPQMGPAASDLENPLRKRG